MKTKTALLNYQKVCFDKLKNIKVGALFMEMGTGKTRTAIEFIAHRQSKVNAVFWFCPVSLKHTIYKQFLEHTDICDSDILVFNDKTDETSSSGYFLYIIGIESMASSKRVVVTVNKLITNNSFVIVDESSYIKGHRALRTERITRISEKAKYRMVLTGTPISQGIVDLYAQFRFLSSKILGYNSFYSFAANHLEYSDKYPGMIVRAHNTEWIAAKIKPYVYQVTKAECLSLPDKVYESRYFYMTREQRFTYEDTKEKILTELEYNNYESVDGKQSMMSSLYIFRLFNYLQQIASGFINELSDNKKITKHLSNNRIDTLLEVLHSIPESSKVVIFAKFEYDIIQIKEATEKEFGEGALSFFYGKTSEQNRNKQIDTFRYTSRFLLSTQSCGGHGFTLTEADYVVFYNNGFKYSERLQAEDRIHRIGQKNKCTYIDIWCDCGIEDRIRTAMANKGNVVEEFKEEIDSVKDDKTDIKELIKSL